MPTAHPSARVEIDAPLETVWAVMLDVDAYGQWNPFVFRAECANPPTPGDPIVLHVRWPNGRTSTSHERITVVEPPGREGDTARATLAYAYEGLPARVRLIRSIRFQRLSQVLDGPTVYDTVGEFSGPLVRFAGPRRIENGFRRHAEALKQRAESLR